MRSASSPRRRAGTMRRLFQKRYAPSSKKNNSESQAKRHI